MFHSSVYLDYYILYVNTIMCYLCVCMCEREIIFVIEDLNINAFTSFGGTYEYVILFPVSVCRPASVSVQLCSIALHG